LSQNWGTFPEKAIRFGCSRIHNRLRQILVVCVQILLPLLLGHDLQILESILGGMPLGIGGRSTASVANTHGQSGELNQTLELAREGLLLYVHVGYLELVLGRDLAQQLDVVYLGALKASLLETKHMEPN